MKSKDFSRFIALLGSTIVLGGGCVARTQGSVEANSDAPVVFTEQPTLVEVDGGVWVVRDSEYPVYFVDDDYWVYRNDVWYRSHSYERGWAVVEAPAVPVVVAHRDHRLYVRYHGVATAQTRIAPRRQGEPGHRPEPQHRAEPEHAAPPGHDGKTEHRPEEHREERKEERQQAHPAGAEPRGEHGGRTEAAPAKVKKHEEKKHEENKGGRH